MINDPLYILLVEDNPGDVRLIKEELKEPGVPHVVVHADRLDEAIERLRMDYEQRIDVVLLDLSLPDASGLEAVERLRDTVPALPIVVLTGLDDENVAFRAVEEGVQDYFVKGKVNGSVLVRALRYAIERKRADEALRREEEVMRTAKMGETMMGILGRDLRVPLQSIGASAAILVKGDLEPAYASAASRIASNNDRMTKMIDDLLDFARARLGGGYTLTQSDCDLLEICRQVINEVSVSYPPRAIQFAAHGSSWGRWDRGRIAQAFSNLLSNALRHGQDDVPVKVALRHGGADALVEVHNAGPPIPDEVRAHLFEPFYRAQERGRQAPEGLGLGLYIAQQIVLAHRGTIELESEEGTGTTFTVRLPRE
jgi:sigma-B regulation protein RsbU (phosphoserine phosphatase)